MAVFASRLTRLAVFFGALFLLLAGRLVYLQAVVGWDLAAMGLLSRVEALRPEDVRGAIVDRRGEPLTGRRTRYSLALFPAQMEDKAAALESLRAVLPDVSPEGWAAAPVKWKRPLTVEEARQVQALRLSGVVVTAETERYSDFASHAVGYWNDSATGGGGSGVEGAFDAALASGGRRYMAALLDAGSELIPGLRYRAIRLPGRQGLKTVALTLDARVQQAAEDVFDRHAEKGAVVVLDPFTGDVLAMVSRPNFDAASLADYLSDARAPLINRALTAYQPGSVFKLTVAAAALERNLVREKELFLDKGFIDIDGTVFRGWDYKKGARRISFSEAMAQSSNPVFIEVGLRVGMRGLVDFSRRLGFGAPTGLGLPEEASGNLPAADNIYRGEAANLSIGQGQCEATPLQLAALVGAVVDGGVLRRPVLVDHVLDESGETLETTPRAPGKRVFSPETAAALRRMLRGVTESGTGRAAYVDKYGSAGKTGSAETGRVTPRGEGISHAWFAGYAPLAKPRYVAVVFVEDGMSGGDVAAPIFREIMERILR